MSDYDLKNIPILDDIIESDEIDADELKATVSQETDPATTDDSLDLFVDDAADAEKNSLLDSKEPEGGTIDDENIPQHVTDVDLDDNAEIFITEEVTTAVVVEQPPAQEAIDESAVIEPAPIDYRPSEDIHSDNETQPTDKQDSASLDDIVNEVVKQLLPDLEQQLRFLVKQALEDRLPAEMIEQLPNKPH